MRIHNVTLCMSHEAQALETIPFSLFNEIIQLREDVLYFLILQEVDSVRQKHVKQLKNCGERFFLLQR